MGNQKKKKKDDKTKRQTDQYLLHNLCVCYKIYVVICFVSVLT